MNHEQHIAEVEETTMSMDDMSVLRVLMHNTPGLRPVAGGPMDLIPVEVEASDV